MKRTLGLDPTMERLAPLEREWLSKLSAWLAAPTQGQEIRM